MERNFKVVGEYKEINDLTTTEVVKALAYANESKQYKGSDLHEALLDVVMNLGLVRNRLENYMPYKMYGNYGKNEIGFVYSDEYLSLNTYISEMKIQIRECFKDLKLEKVSGLETDTDTQHLLSAWLGFQLKDANKRVVLKYAQKKYPDLTLSTLGLYVYVRKYTRYKVDLDMKNAYILKTIKEMNPDKANKVTWSGLNHLKRIFGYPEEFNEEAEKRKTFVSSHRNELIFWSNTGACMISKEDYRSYCSLLKVEFGLSESQYQRLFDWCLSCKYQGLFKTNDMEIKEIRKKAIEKYGAKEPINRVFAAGISKYASQYKLPEKLKTNDIIPVVLNY